MKPTLAPSAAVREVMDIRQAADFLGISSDSLYRYAATGFIPAFRIGNRWRFRRSRLEEWMDTQSGAAVESHEPKLVRAQQKKPVRSARLPGRTSRTAS
ncbi:MAG TPA: helix-turn-helix domain-containing protein [Acidobacteriaceae bacterium]|nr:helix-turn-helix domain-containing protein [Acidobacteriaceae bacterium]